jgi:hypothetical protein
LAAISQRVDMAGNAIETFSLVDADLIARVSYEAEKAPPKRGCQVGGNAVPKGDQHSLAESSKCVQIDFAYIPMLSARSSRLLGAAQENALCRRRKLSASFPSAR